MIFGYARVSTEDQKLDLQIDQLTKSGCDEIIIEKESGSSTARPALGELLRKLRKGDTLKVWKLDRLGRSMIHLVKTANELAGDGVTLVSLTEGIDFSSSTGKFQLAIISAFAEFELDQIKERTNAGLKAARARGKKGGRRPKMTKSQAESAWAILNNTSKTKTEVAREFGISRVTLNKHLAPFEKAL